MSFDMPEAGQVWELILVASHEMWPVLLVKLHNNEYWQGFCLTDGELHVITPRRWTEEHLCKLVGKRLA